MRIHIKILLSILLAISVAVPFSIDGYILGQYINNFYARFYDPTNPVEDTSNIEWAKIMRGNASAIHEEFLAFERTHTNIPRIGHVIPNEAYLDQQEHSAWRTLFLRLYNRDSAHMKHFPKLQAALAHVPGLYTVIISMIEPRYIGGAHNGIYSGVKRYLLGLEVSIYACMHFCSR